jgi:hypothetical protein
MEEDELFDKYCSSIPILDVEHEKKYHNRVYFLEIACCLLKTTACF